MTEKIKITLLRSTIGRNENQKRVVKALGFRKLHQSRVFASSPSVLGMVNKVAHLVKVEPVVESQTGGEE